MNNSLVQLEFVILPTVGIFWINRQQSATLKLYLLSKWNSNIVGLNSYNKTSYIIWEDYFHRIIPPLQWHEHWFNRTTLDQMRTRNYSKILTYLGGEGVHLGQYMVVVCVMAMLFNVRRLCADLIEMAMQSAERTRHDKPALKGMPYILFQLFRLGIGSLKNLEDLQNKLQSKQEEYGRRTDNITLDVLPCCKFLCELFGIFRKHQPAKRKSF